MRAQGDHHCSNKLKFDHNDKSSAWVANNIALADMAVYCSVIYTYNKPKSILY